MILVAQYQIDTCIINHNNWYLHSRSGRMVCKTDNQRNQYKALLIILYQLSLPSWRSTLLKSITHLLQGIFIIINISCVHSGIIIIGRKSNNTVSQSNLVIDMIDTKACVMAPLPYYGRRAYTTYIHVVLPMCLCICLSIYFFICGHICSQILLCLFYCSPVNVWLTET